MGRRVFLIVLDSAGVGEAPDAAKFGDVGSDTFGTCVRSGNLQVPNLERLGLFGLDGTSFQKKYHGKASSPEGCYVKLAECSAGKDTTVGHWEISGIVTPSPMPTYPRGFPPELIRKFEELTGKKVLCNKVYSGSEVIKAYGDEQVRTGGLIVYTSADSVFQIAAHEEVVPVGELYDICKKARKMLTGPYAVGRVIARPFTGTGPDNYTRTIRRHDFSLEPPRETVLDALKENGRAVIGVGKIQDIFAGKGLTETYPNQGNAKNMERTLALADQEFEGLCFVNLVDFDMLYGHRNDISGYTEALNQADVQIGELMKKMRTDDLLIITADHGCDPGTKSTDHSREYIPCLCFGKTLKKGVNMGIKTGFSHIGATVAEYLGVKYTGDGGSFLNEIC